MRIPIPFIESQTATDCGPTALLMVLRYFGDTTPLEEVARRSYREPSGMTWTPGLAAAAGSLGFSVRVITEQLGDVRTTLESEYYDRYASEHSTTSLLATAQAAGVAFTVDSLSPESLLELLTPEQLVICLLNWDVLRGRDGYTGHFVPLVGYDDLHVLFHNPGLDDPTPCFRVSRERFVRAWTSPGTDRDCIVISRRSPENPRSNGDGLCDSGS